MSAFECADPGCPHCEDGCKTCGHRARRSARWICDHCGARSPCDGGELPPPFCLRSEGWDDTIRPLYEIDACSSACFLALMERVPSDPMWMDPVTGYD